MSPVIEAVGLTKHFANVHALDGLDLTAESGRLTALLGPNGAGKTTTVEILVGVRTRTAGTVRVLGEDPGDDRRAWRARIGVVPQNTAEYLDLTVRELFKMCREAGIGSGRKARGGGVVLAIR